MYGGLFSDTFLYTVLMLFYCTVALVLMLNECENVSQRMEPAGMQHTPFFLPVYYPSSPSELNPLTDSFI